MDKLKIQITECINSVNDLANKVDAISKEAISNLPKENIALGVNLMDLQRILNQAKSAAEKTGWSLDKLA